jgi:hypothetical protein
VGVDTIFITKNDINMPMSCVSVETHSDKLVHNN